MKELQATAARARLWHRLGYLRSRWSDRVVYRVDLRLNPEIAAKAAFLQAAFLQRPVLRRSSVRVLRDGILTNLREKEGRLWLE